MAMDDFVILDLDDEFCSSARADLAGVRFEISDSAGDGGRTRWAATTSYGETFRSILFAGRKSVPDRRSYSTPEMLDAARTLTGLDEVVVFRAQANVMLPGQGLGRHTDVPEFRGARRWSFPDWLLVAMLHSGIYDDEQVRIVSAVAWPMATNGGDLRVFDRANETLLGSFTPERATAVVCDSYRLPHDVDRIPGDEVTVGPGDAIGLERDGGDEGWVLRRTDGSTVVLRPDEVRLSILVKMACFRDAAERDRYFDGSSDPLDEAAVIARLAKGLPVADERSDGGAFHQELVDHYVSYMPG